MNKSIKVKFMILLSCIIFFPSVSFAHCDGDDNGNCTGILVIGVRPSPPSIGGGPVGGLVTQIDRGGSYEAEDSKKQEEKKKEEKKKKCLSDANNTNNLCIENVNRRHLERFNSCVNTAWFGYFLNLISGGKLSNTPQLLPTKTRAYK